jgi:lysophospholipase L1-like esterase
VAGEYNCNAKRDLMVALHSHKPISCVILALGTNDLKTRFHLSPAEIVAGIRVLIRHVRQATGVSGDAGGTTLSLRPPKVLVVTPPVVSATAKSRLWGFADGVEARSAELARLLVAGGAGTEAEGVSVIDGTTAAAPSPLDGVHFDAAGHAQLAKEVAARLRCLLELP